MSFEEGVQQDSLCYAIVFADIIDSTRLYNNLGDQTAHEVVDDGLSLLSEIVQQYYGRVIKTIGDEIMAVFDDPKDALLAAVFMQQVIEDHKISEDNAGQSLLVRVGIHYGAVVERDGDVFGMAVNAASRLVDKAKGSEVLITQQVLDVVGVDWKDKARFIQNAQFKGIDESFSVYSLHVDHADEDNITACLDDEDFDFDVGQLVLVYRDQKIVVSSECPRVSLGRDPQNDVVVSGKAVSREHAVIEVHQGRFRIKDMSSNGTYIKDDDGRVQQILRQETFLTGEGVVSLGRHPDRDDAIVVSYEWLL